MLAVLAVMAGSGSPSAMAQESGALSGIKAFTGGGGHSLAVERDGRVLSWGFGAHLQLGLGPNAASALLPTQVLQLTGVSDVAGGEFHSLALKEDGTVWSFGENDQGQLGTGKIGSPQGTAVQVQGLRGVSQIDADFNQSYAILENGAVRAWGANDFGQLCNGTKKRSAVPVAVNGLDGMALAAGWHHTLALAGKQAGAAQGTVYGWGEQRYGQVGDGKTCTGRASAFATRRRP